jgi:exonuclease III
MSWSDPTAGYFFVLLGDFNLEATDPEYDHLVGSIDGELGRISSTDDFIDTWIAAGHEENEGVTYIDTSSFGESRGMRIDFAFVDESMQKQVIGTRIDEQALGSDHQPYWIELDCAPDD